jgi:hypothetical protein
MIGYRCPRCGHAEVIYRHLRVGSGYETSRTIDEYFCPSCNLLEAADSDRPDCADVAARWRDAKDDPRP